MDLEDYAKLKRVHADQITRALTDSTGTARSSRSSRLPPPAGRGLVAGVALAVLAVVALVIIGVISSGGLTTHPSTAAQETTTSSPPPASSDTSAPALAATLLDARQPERPIPGSLDPAAAAAPAPPAAPTTATGGAVGVAAPAVPAAAPAAAAPRVAPAPPAVAAPQAVVAAPAPASTHAVALAEQQHNGTSHPASFYPWAYQQALAAVQHHSSTWSSESPYTRYFSSGSKHSDQFYIDMYWYAHSGFFNHTGHLHDRNPYAEVLHWYS